MIKMKARRHALFCAFIRFFALFPRFIAPFCAPLRLYSPFRALSDQG
jgi:hypothetical protein